MRALLDVNVLIALLDAAHVHHASAMSWLEKEIGHGWASCPLTQNGCVRILSQPTYTSPIPALQVAKRLAEATQDASHAFWPDSYSLLDADAIDWEHILGHRQITDAYLLGLAVRNGGRFVTFDRRLPLNTVPGATVDHLCVIAP
jgi:toxin-antitoxin system PIN domain toxin